MIEEPFNDDCKFFYKNNKYFVKIIDYVGEITPNNSNNLFMKFPQFITLTRKVKLLKLLS